MTERDTEPDSSGWIKTKQAAKALGVTDRTVRRWADDGTLRSERIQERGARPLVVSQEDVMRLRDKRVADGTLVEEEWDGSFGEPLSLGPALSRIFERHESVIRENADLKNQLQVTSSAHSSVEQERDRAREEAERLRAELAAERDKKPRGFFERLFGS